MRFHLPSILHFYLVSNRQSTVRTLEYMSGKDGVAKPPDLPRSHPHSTRSRGGQLGWAYVRKCANRGARCGFCSAHRHARAVIALERAFKFPSTYLGSSRLISSHLISPPPIYQAPLLHRFYGNNGPQVLLLGFPLSPFINKTNRHCCFYQRFCTKRCCRTLGICTRTQSIQAHSANRWKLFCLLASWPFLRGELLIQHDSAICSLPCLSFLPLCIFLPFCPRAATGSPVIGEAIPRGLLFLGRRLELGSSSIPSTILPHLLQRSSRRNTGEARCKNSEEEASHLLTPAQAATFAPLEKRNTLALPLQLSDGWETRAANG